jgi:glycosyltransferase involved in cell wall biosynthesis
LTESVCIVRQRDYYELSLRREAEALRDVGYDVDVICLRGPGDLPVEVVNGVRLHRLPFRRRRSGAAAQVLDYLTFFLAASIKVARLHADRRYRVVQANSMPDFLAFTAVLPRLSGAKVVAFMKEPTPELGQTLYESTRLTRLLQRVEQIVLRYVDLAFTVTQELKDTYVARGANPDKIVVVLNGPDERHILQFAADVRPDPRYFTAICHGLVEERYGQDTMVEAVRLASQRVPTLRLRITGTGGGVKDLLRRIDEAGVGDRVEYLGWLAMPDLVRELQASDVGIVAQKTSPYSNLVHTNKMYEYMLLDRPVIASRLRSTSNYFDDSAVEYFEPDSAESLAEALVRLHDDRERRHSLASRARQLYAEYGWTRQRQIYLGAYEALVGAGTPCVNDVAEPRNTADIRRRRSQR